MQKTPSSPLLSVETAQYLQQAAHAFRMESDMVEALVAGGWQFDSNTGVYTHPDKPDSIVSIG